MADIRDTSIAILVDNYFEQIEFTEPKETLEHAGAEVTVISTGADVLHGLNGVEMGDDFVPDMVLAEVDFEDFDMLIIPGGVINSDKLRMNVKARDWVHYCMDNEIPLAAMCHAPWLLVSAGVCDGLRMTSYYTLQDDIKNAHGTWIDSQLVVDGSIITSRTPDDLPVFCGALIDAIEHLPATADVLSY